MGTSCRGAEPINLVSSTQLRGAPPFPLHQDPSPSKYLDDFLESACMSAAHQPARTERLYAYKVPETRSVCARSRSRARPSLRRRPVTPHGYEHSLLAMRKFLKLSRGVTAYSNSEVCVHDLCGRRSPNPGNPEHIVSSFECLSSRTEMTSVHIETQASGGRTLCGLSWRGCGTWGVDVSFHTHNNSTTC